MRNKLSFKETLLGPWDFTRYSSSQLPAPRLSRLSSNNSQIKRQQNPYSPKRIPIKSFLTLTPSQIKTEIRQKPERIKRKCFRKNEMTISSQIDSSLQGHNFICKNQIKTSKFKSPARFQSDSNFIILPKLQQTKKQKYEANSEYITVQKNSFEIKFASMLSRLRTLKMNRYPPLRIASQLKYY